MFKDPNDTKSFLQEKALREQFIAEQFKERYGLNEGARVRYIGGTSELQFRGYGNWASDPRGILEIDAIYEIERTTVGRSWSYIELVGFENKIFSTVLFEPVKSE